MKPYPLPSEWSICTIIRRSVDTFACDFTIKCDHPHFPWNQLISITASFVKKFTMKSIFWRIFQSQVDLGVKIDSTWVDLSQSDEIDLTRLESSTGNTNANITFLRRLKYYLCKKHVLTYTLFLGRHCKYSLVRLARNY